MSKTLKKKSEVYTDRHSSTVKAEVGARVQRRQNMTGQQPLSNSSTQVHHARYLQHTNPLYITHSIFQLILLLFLHNPTKQYLHRAKDALKTFGSLLFLVVCIRGSNEAVQFRAVIRQYIGFPMAPENPGTPALLSTSFNCVSALVYGQLTNNWM